jgi:hypothetical protein
MQRVFRRDQRARSARAFVRASCCRGARSGINPVLLIGGILGGIGFLVIGLVVVVIVIVSRAQPAKPNPNDFARQNRPVAPQMPAPHRPKFPRAPRVFPQGKRPTPNIPTPNVPGLNVPEPPKLDLIAWNVKVDPPAETYEFDVEKDIRIPTNDKSGAGYMLLPAMPTAFVSVGRNSSDRETSTVYDLRTGKKVTDITGIRLDFNTSRLS